MQTPERFVEKASAALGADLKAVILYGSAAVAPDRAKDVNLFFVVARADADTLRRLAVPVRDWTDAGHPAPVVVAEDEVRRSFDVFPMEFSDMKERHRILHGTADWLSRIAVRPAHLRHQLEFELRSKLVLLRQAWLSSTGRRAHDEALLGRAVAPAGALFRAALRLLGAPAPPTLPEAARSLEAHAPVDAAAWDTVWRLRHGEKVAGETVSHLFPRLLTGLEALTRFVDAQSASQEEST
jgi:hypothetical protein